MSSRHSDEQASILRKFEELSAEFDHKDIFNHDVNATRARTLAIAGDWETKKRSTPSLLLQQVSAKSKGASEPSGKPHPNAHGMSLLHQRLQEVEEASTAAQLKGISVEMELKMRHAAVAEPKDGSLVSSRQLGKGGKATKSIVHATIAQRRLSSHQPVVAGGGATAGALLKRSGGGPSHHPSTLQSESSHRFGSEPSASQSRDRSFAMLHSKDDGGVLHGRVPSPVERGNLAPSEWFQRSAEHLDYPEAEKQVRHHLKRRDEPRRGVTPVERYTVPFSAHLSEKERQWQESSAKVSVSVIHPDPLAALQKQQTAKRSAVSVVEGDTAGSTRRPARNGASDLPRASSPIQKKAKRPVGGRRCDDEGDEEDLFEKMQDRSQFLHLASGSKKARKVYQSSIAKELLSAANMLSNHVPLFANEPNKSRRSRASGNAGNNDAEEEDSFLHREVSSDGELSFSSSDSGEMEEDARVTADREGIRHLGDESNALQVPGVRGPAVDERTDDLLDTCDLVECCVVCLCQQLGGARTSITREQVILRTILIHALHSALPALEDELSRRQSFVNKTVSVPPAQRLSEAALISRLLRSWTKGVEVLLTLDLGTINDEGIPFSVHNERHTASMVQLYCRLHEAKEERVHRLFDRWKANKEEADSAIIKNDTSKLLKAPPVNVVRATELVRHFQTVASITTDDLALLDHEAANVAAKQQALAQSFLDRVSRFLPESDEGKPMDERRAAEAGEITERDLLLHNSPPNLRHVLLHYAGLLRPSAKLGIPKRSGAAQNASEESTTSEGFSFSASHVSTVGVTKFLNVFRSTWGRTPLAGDVPENEAADRATTMQNGTMIVLFDAYFHLLSPVIQDKIRFLIRDEKKRAAELRAKIRSDSDAFNKALGAFGPVSTRDPEQEAKEALHHVERYQLIDKYSTSRIDPQTAEKLKKSVESSEAWFQYEASRRAARIAAANPQNEDAWNDAGDGSGGHASPSSDKQSGGSPAKNSGTTRMEMIRIRKLQELEGCWHKLGIGYSVRVSLHDKWNHPTKEIRHVDTALKLYKECIAAVEAREAAVHSVMANEKVEDKAERNAKRPVLFSAMCTAGQKCELVAKKLFNDTGDELYVKSDVYLAKLRDDFARISQLIRSS